MASPFLHTLQVLARPAPVSLVDARAPEAYATGHAAGAVSCSADAWAALSSSPATSLHANVAFWEGQIRGLGLDESADVVVYDSGGLPDAARVWFILQHFGVRAHILAGEWTELGPAETGPSVPPAPSTTFTARPGTGRAGLMTLPALRSSLPSVQVLDMRTPAEYTGGHIPGALSFPHAQALASGGPLGRLLPTGDLRELLASAGVTQREGGGRVVTHCGGGGRGSFGAAVALHAGHADVQVYYRGWGEWSRDDTCPVEKGEHK